jgi:sec-independent protein translocase protein TatA
MSGIGAPEIILVLLVLLLLFGAKKLPELARGGGRALRIFKAETKGLMDEEDEKPAIDSQRSTSEAKPVTDTERRPEDR